MDVDWGALELLIEVPDAADVTIPRVEVDTKVFAVKEIRVDNGPTLCPEFEAVAFDEDEEPPFWPLDMTEAIKED